MFTKNFAETKTGGGIARSLAAIALLLGAGFLISVTETKAAVPGSPISWVTACGEEGESWWSFSFLLGSRWCPEHRERAGFLTGRPRAGGLKTASLADEQPPPPPPPPPPDEPHPIDRDTDILTLTAEPSPPSP